MRHICSAIVSLTALLLATNSWAEGDLNKLEAKWILAASPVLEFAREQGLTIDIVVVPEHEASDVPLSMGVRDGRCKLVLSLRGNPEPESTLEGVPDDDHPLLIEIMTAHEIAHCWRFSKGAWHKLPAGFIESTEVIDSKELRAKKKEMRATRREEGYADLVALAWTLRQHPESYLEVHDWLKRVRHDQPLSGSYHDTRAWLTLAKDPTVFTKNESPFEQVQELWAKGIRNDD